MSIDLVYLASPYSKYPYGKVEAYAEVCKKAAELMLDGYNVFCPIAHSHPIETIGMNEIKDGDFWLRQDFAVLEKCSKMMVYMMPGWNESVGVKAEMLLAQDLGIPVEYIPYKKDNNEVHSGRTEEFNFRTA